MNTARQNQQTDKQAHESRPCITLPRHGDFALDKETASDDDALVWLEMEVFSTEREDCATRCAPFSSTLARKARHLARAERAGHSVSTASEAGGSRASSPPRRQSFEMLTRNLASPANVAIATAEYCSCKDFLTQTAPALDKAGNQERAPER